MKYSVKYLYVCTVVYMKKMFWQLLNDRLSLYIPNLHKYRTVMIHNIMMHN